MTVPGRSQVLAGPEVELRLTVHVDEHREKEGRTAAPAQGRTPLLRHTRIKTRRTWHTGLDDRPALMSIQNLRTRLGQQQSLCERSQVRVSGGHPDSEHLTPVTVDLKKRTEGPRAMPREEGSRGRRTAAATGGWKRQQGPSPGLCTWVPGFRSPELGGNAHAAHAGLSWLPGEQQAAPPQLGLWWPGQPGGTTVWALGRAGAAGPLEAWRALPRWSEQVGAPRQQAEVNSTSLTRPPRPPAAHGSVLWGGGNLPAGKRPAAVAASGSYVLGNSASCWLRVPLWIGKQRGRWGRCAQRKCGLETPQSVKQPWWQ